MSLEGNLEELGLGEILQIVNLSRKTGLLSISSSGKEGSIFFRQGQVVRAASSTYQQSLGEVLIQKGIIDLAVLRKTLAVQQEGGFRERLGSILDKNFGISQEIVEQVVGNRSKTSSFPSLPGQRDISSLKFRVLKIPLMAPEWTRCSSCLIRG